MTKKIAFSEKALEQMNRAAPSHALISAKTPWTWFLLGAVSLFLTAIVVWGFHGSMVESVRGNAITLLSGGVRPIVAEGSGILTHLNIHAGSSVSVDQVVGQIYNSERVFNVRKLEAEYERLKADASFMEQGIERITGHQLKSEREKISLLEKLERLQKQSKNRTLEIAGIYGVLSQKNNIVSKATYYQMLDQVVQTEMSFLSTYFQSANVDISLMGMVWQKELKLLELRQQVEQKRADLEFAQRLYQEADWLVASFDGQVLEVLAEEGAFVQSGQKIALVGADLDQGLYLVAFVPADQGKKIRNGMSAYFAPAAAPAAEYGYIQCVVREVSSTPVNAEGVLAELMNHSLTQMVVGKTAVMRVELEMVPDGTSPSGYHWTSRKGYSRNIVNGMIGEVIINTEYRAPASYVIPALRENMQKKPQPAADAKQ